MYRLNLSNEPFIIHDSANPNRLIAFASKTSLNYLSTYQNNVINKKIKIKVEISHEQKFKQAIVKQKIFDRT
jgi:hypothetical protein